MKWLLLASLAIGCTSPAARPREPEPVVIRTDFTVASEPGITIAVHEISTRMARRTPVLLVHGAGLGAMSFDLPVAGYSLAEDLARAGYPTYALDVRGWGRSTRPAVLDGEPDHAPPAVTSDEAMRDITAVVSELRRRHRRPVAFVGWATGGHWVGMYAAAHPSDVDRVVMLNAMYGTPGPWPLREALEDPDAPGQLSANVGAYSFRTGTSLVGRWNSSIPGDDKDAWRDPRVVDAYISAALGSDPTATTRSPASIRVPSGPLRDSFALATGTKLWDARAITAPALVIRSQLDFWSRPEDVEALRRDLRSMRFVEIPGATHFVFLDRRDHGRARFVRELLAFLGA